MKTAVSIIFCLVVGAFSGYVLAPSRIEVREITKEVLKSDPNLDELVKKLQDIENIDVEEYHRLKSDAEKFKKANEIYGKVMQLFLASLASKLDARKWKPLTTPQAVPMESLSRSTPSVEKKWEEPPVPLPSSGQEVFLDENPEESFRDLRHKLRNPTAQYQSANIGQTPLHLMEQMQGVYEGEIQLYGNSRERWHLRIDSNYVYDGKKWSGSSLIQLSDAEHGVFSTSRSEGDNADFQGIPGDKKTLIVKASPSIFFHLWPVNNRTFRGLMYERNKKNKKYKLAGKLKRLHKL